MASSNSQIQRGYTLIIAVGILLILMGGASARFGAINGTVKDSSTSSKVIGALVEAMQNDIIVTSTRTNSNGNYSLLLSGGNYKLRASAIGYIVEINPVVSTGNTIDLNLHPGELLIYDEFIKPNLNTTIWNSSTNGLGYFYFTNYTYNNSNFSIAGIGSGYGGAGDGRIASKMSVSLSNNKVVIFEGRIDAYEDNNYAYGDKQPRGLRVDDSGNNAIEFISYTGSIIQTRTVSSGVATTKNYDLGESVNYWKYVYRIEASPTIVKFYLNGILIATHTSNIPTGNLKAYMDTNYGDYGNVPIAADYIYLAAFGTKRITTNTSNQNFPAISGNRIVWQDNRNGNWDIYTYDISTGKEKHITTKSSSQNFPAISGNRIVWQDMRNGNWDIYMYDISTGKTRQITTNTANQTSPSISGKRIVWADNRNGNMDIYMINSTGVTKQITTNTSKQDEPVITRNRMVWEDNRHGNWDIYMYDLSTGKEKRITTNYKNQNYPDISGNRIVWQDMRNGNWDIYMYDFSTGKEKRITINTANQLHPTICGNRIVWEDKRNGNADIYMYDLSTDTEKRITTNTAGQWFPAIDGNRIVWYDNRNGNTDIYMYSI